MKLHNYIMLVFVVTTLIACRDSSLDNTTRYILNNSSEQNSQNSTGALPPGTKTPAPPPTNLCQLPPKPECGAAEGPAGVYGCCTEHANPTMNNVIEAAITQIKKDKPELFNGERVLNEDAYMLGVVDILRSYGYCATRGGPSDEVGIKTTNNMSEQYDILLSSGFIRHDGFTVNCMPARF